MSDTPRFPVLSPEQMEKRLTPPPAGSRIRVVIDTDVDNEIDDFFALAWMFLSQDRFQIEGMYAAPYSFAARLQGMADAYEIEKSKEPPTPEQQSIVDLYGRQLAAVEALGFTPYDLALDPHLSAPPGRGMEMSYIMAKEILEVFDVKPDGLLFKGSDRFLGSAATPVKSAAVAHLIDSARASSLDDPLYVMAIACITNVVSAILLAPDIVENIVVVWTAGYPTTVTTLPNHSLNLEQDVAASQLLFSCGVPLVYLPGFQVGAQLSLSVPELEKDVRGVGPLGDLLYQRYITNPLLNFYGVLSIDDLAYSKVIWDVIVPAWGLNPRLAPSQLTPSPISTDDLYWKHEFGRPMLREAHGVSRNGVFADLFKRLKGCQSS